MIFWKMNSKDIVVKYASDTLIKCRRFSALFLLNRHNHSMASGWIWAEALVMRRFECSVSRISQKRVLCAPRNKISLRSIRDQGGPRRPVQRPANWVSDWLLFPYLCCTASSIPKEPYWLFPITMLFSVPTNDRYRTVSRLALFC